jgi:glycosyltransferase involved in cell wall biosynthesis
MRVALVHSFYSDSAPSGENIAVELQLAALRRHGFEVSLVGIRTDDLSAEPAYQLRTAVNVVADTGPSPADALTEFAPDVVHVHNLFPNFSRRWLARWPGPIVATLHNYRAVCSAGTLSRAGGPCRECIDHGNSLPALRHACYRGSRAATLPVAARTWRGLSGDPLIRRADRLLFLAPRSLDYYRSAGLDPSRAEIVPNFVETNPDSERDRTEPTKPWLIAARLSPEKGITDVLRAWPAGVSLDVYGNGPLQAEVEALATGSVTYHGPTDRQALLARLPASRGLVFSSHFGEGLPTIYLEALAAGIPVLATPGNSAADDVARCDSGVVLDDWSPAGFTAGIDIIDSSWANYAAAARERFEAMYSEQSWLRSMERVYDDVVRRRCVR